MKTRRWGPFRQEWYSICSKHSQHKESCHMCQAGQWINVWKHHIGAAFFRVSPTLWRLWANRPWSPTRRFLEATFPGLRKSR